MIKFFKQRKWIRIIEKSGLFDKAYYLFTYPDVREQDVDPVSHYINFGASEGRDPSSDFSTDFYLRNNQDVRESAVNPLVHYINFGSYEGRRTKEEVGFHSENQLSEKTFSEVIKFSQSFLVESKGSLIAVYTAIFGDYDFIKEPSYVEEGVDYYCFTDNPNLESKIFKIIRVGKLFKDNTRNARMFKLLPHIFLKGYNYSVWIDGSTKIRGLSLKSLVEESLKEHCIAVHSHKDRNCIYEEAKECILQKKDDKEAILKQISFYKDRAFPSEVGLVETAQVLRRHNDTSAKFNEAWFYYLNKYSKRDQLSFNYVAWETGINYATLKHTQWLNQYFKNYLHFKLPFDHLEYTDTVSLVMLVRNALDITKVSTRSILELTRYKNYELVIVDNDSNEETKDYLAGLASECKNVRLITNKENLSFSAANNKAVKESRSKYILLINNDVEVIDENWLNILVDELSSDKKVAAVGPILLYPNYTIQSASINININNDKMLELATENKKYRHSGYVESITGGCLLIERAFYNKIGGLDERFFYGQEDIDFCLKILRERMKIKLVANCELIHHESYTRTFNSTTLENREKIKAKWKGKLEFMFNDDKVKSFSEVIRGEISYKSYSCLQDDIRSNIHRLNKSYDLVVGIPRSGMVPAYMIGLLKNLPVISYDEFVNDITPTKGDRNISSLSNEVARHVLFVDDSINLGNSYSRIMSRMPREYRGTPYSYDFLAIYASEKNKYSDVIIFNEVKLPRLFQWNYRNHAVAQYSCYDIDGVLCVDPSDEENDDGERYIDFVLNAKPLYIPNYKIKALVTSRLEKYRKETEVWLKKNNVIYDRLYMLDLPSKEERIKNKAHGKFKAQVYKDCTEAVLFIESNSKQAKEIFELTGKPVICTENDVYYSQSVVHRRS